MIVPEIRIREAVAADESALAELDLATWSPLHAVQPRPEPGQEFFDERHLPEHYLVAEFAEAGERAAEAAAPSVVGYLRLVPPTPLAANAHVRQIQGLAVADSARGRGVARALLRAAMDRARAQGAGRITLRVLGHNKPARALYEAEGFRVEGVLPGEFLLEGAYVDDVFMGRSLA
ncbi:GNAT family N-acetyltransferase [Streptomyces roseicoloratus]|uniref:GNAT family N-acetyltransferase n=1 Tax=Streptomyces roseicoloratus TaxID=2508722 RepID=A0ABY9S0S3_9ACTN|nr:GNAT family N-acetyltransferase [Streptomyces roseicoloratus]WMX47431.1 GNAT family N-acetyltransferase [Streptomyces roseicoloratus]